MRCEGVRDEYRVATTQERIRHDSPRPFPESREQTCFKRNWNPRHVLRSARREAKEQVRRAKWGQTAVRRTIEFRPRDLFGTHRGLFLPDNAVLGFWS